MFPSIKHNKSSVPTTIPCWKLEIKIIILIVEYDPIINLHIDFIDATANFGSKCLN